MSMVGIDVVSLQADSHNIEAFVQYVTHTSYIWLNLWQS